MHLDLGRPGRGKTMLSLFLIEELERKAQGSDKMVLLYICNHQDEKRNNAVAIMRSFIYQILTKCPKLFDHVRSSFDNEKETKLVLASSQTLWRTFTALRRACENTIHCVLDGLDECDDESVGLFARNLADYFSSETTEIPNFKLIILSRALTGLKAFHEVKVEPDNNVNTNSDIKRFVSEKIQRLEIPIPGFREIKVKLGETLLWRAEGMFLWIGFVTDKLLKKTTCTQILDALNEIPKGLPAMYSRILSKTEKNRRPILAKLLRWVTMAVRPLIVEELAAALKIDHTEHLSREQIVLDYISMCGNILQLNNGNFGCIHQSAIDYLLEGSLRHDKILENFHITEDSAHSEITGACIDAIEVSILSHKTLIMPKAKANLAVHSLLGYASRNWFKHARGASAKLNSDLILNRPFFRKQSTTRDY